MKKLLVGIHTFSQIINEDYLYIDNTKEAYELIDNYKYVFLSRPRRFGKSLFLTTLVEDCTNQSSIDMSIVIKDNVYIIEFKMKQGDGIAQIMGKNIMKNNKIKIKRFI